MQEDGSEVEETVNEASNLLQYMSGKTSHQGLRINMTRKQQITRNFKDEETDLQVVYTKIPMGGACIASAGKCIIVATFNEIKNHKSADCNETVQQMARYFAKSTWPSADDAGDTSPVTWNTYIEKLLVGKGNIAQTLIVLKDSEKVLASTPDFELKTYDAEMAQEDGTDKTETVNEMKNIIKMMTRSKPSQGLRINQVKYQIIRTFDDENSGCYTVYGKKTLGGCGVVDCGKVIVIATFDEKQGHTSVGMNNVLSDLAKHVTGKK